MVSLRGAETPRQLLNSKGSCMDNAQQHESWYDDIRSIVSDRITSEEDRMPSRTSMWRHWLRSCWVAQLYQSAHEQDPFALLPPPEQSGWKIQNSEYSVDWECPQLQKQIQETIDFLMKGCSCKDVQQWDAAVSRKDPHVDQGVTAETARTLLYTW